MPIRTLIADLQGILDGFKSQGFIAFNIEVAGKQLLTIKIPLPKA